MPIETYVKLADDNLKIWTLHWGSSMVAYCQLGQGRKYFIRLFPINKNDVVKFIRVVVNKLDVAWIS